MLLNDARLQRQNAEGFPLALRNCFPTAWEHREMHEQRQQVDLSTAVRFFLAGLGLGALLAIIALPAPGDPDTPGEVRARPAITRSTT